MCWFKRRDPTVELERVSHRLLGEIAEAVAAVKAAAKPNLVAAEHLRSAAAQRIQEEDIGNERPI